jgi:mitochondrial chaperone BCS1
MWSSSQNRDPIQPTAFRFPITMIFNQTSFTELDSLSENILEALIPGYPLISRSLRTLGLDVSWILRFFVMPLAIITCLHYFYRHVSGHLYNLFTSSIHVESDDRLFDIVLAFLVRKSASTGLRSGIATTRPDKSTDLQSEDFLTGPGARKRMRLEPDEQHIWFLHNRRLFRFQRSKTRAPMGFVVSQLITLTVFGFRTQPIEDLIAEMQDQWFAGSKPTTTIMRPLAKEVRDRAGYPWAVIAQRPSRSIDTIVLEEALKQSILSDISNFWSLGAAEWYSGHGIAYRRGYHFWGPPGTGKSSLAFAVAGVFNVDIYCVSVNDPDLTEGGFLSLLSHLSRRSILLLEDIDSAGLRRESHRSSDGRKESGISLSGLLNAIDGVASSEGRILIITSNMPDHLDGALTRPGRIDFSVEFKSASKEQSREIFLRMYSHPRRPSANNAKTDAIKDLDLELLADRFKNEIPDRLLTPAELQGFLLTMTDPRDAVDHVAIWRDDTLERLSQIQPTTQQSLASDQRSV